MPLSSIYKMLLDNLNQSVWSYQSGPEENQTVKILLLFYFILFLLLYAFCWKSYKCFLSFFPAMTLWLRKFVFIGTSKSLDLQQADVCVL